MAQETNIKEIIKSEIIRCKEDPIYFMKKYVWIQHPIRGRVQFNLFPFQEKVLKLLINNDYSIILKSRQLGISTLVGPGLALWLMLFHEDKNILVIATKQETAKNLVTKVRFAYDNLPSWIKIKSIEDNKLSLKLSNGSQIKAVSAASDSGRSEAVSLLIMDECAFIEDADTIWGASQQTLSTGGKAILLSTPNGVGNFFHKQWVKAEAGENKFTPIKLPWQVHPERNQKWRDEQDELLGIKLASQECDATFETSGHQVIPGELLDFYEKTYVKPPSEKRGIESNYWVWEYADYSRSYVIIADVARGDGQDYSTFHIIDLDSSTQSAEFKGQIGTTEFARLLVSAATEYNNALLVVENSNVGWAVLQSIIELGYKNLFYSSKSDTSMENVENYISKMDNLDNMVPGWTTSLKSRPLIISKLDSYLKEKSFTFYSKRLLEELKVFVWKNGKAQAQTGYNDDLVMALAIGLYLRDTAFKFKQHGVELTKAALSGFVKTTDTNKIYNTRFSHLTPWEMDLGLHGKQDLNWLL